MPKNLLYDLRIKKGLSINRVAHSVGVAPSTISKWENSLMAPSAKKVELLAEELGVESQVIKDVIPWCRVPGCNNKVSEKDLCSHHVYQIDKRETFTKVEKELQEAKTIGERLKLLRDKHQLSKEALATELGVTVGTINAWENNVITPKLYVLIDMASFFKVGVRFLERGVIGE